MKGARSELLARYLPEFDFAEVHDLEICSSRERVWQALREADLAASGVIRWLMRLRGMAPPRPMRLRDFTRWRFCVLEEEPPTHVVLGLVGRFWTPRGGLLAIDREMFLSEIPKGCARAACSFEIESIGTDAIRLSTETRIQAADVASRRQLARYWRLIGPFSGWIRRQALRRVRREALS